MPRIAQCRSRHWYGDDLWRSPARWWRDSESQRRDTEQLAGPMGNHSQGRVEGQLPVLFTEGRDRLPPRKALIEAMMTEDRDPAPGSGCQDPVSQRTEKAPDARAGGVRGLQVSTHPLRVDSSWTAEADSVGDLGPSSPGSGT